jgi:amino acid permease
LYLVFLNRIHGASQGEYDEDLNITPEIRTHFRRSGRRYPYRSHLQWMRAAYGLVACLLFALFQGWETFLTPMSVKDFIASYIAVRTQTSVLQGWEILKHISSFYLQYFLLHTSLKLADSIRPIGD